MCTPDGRINSDRLGIFLLARRDVNAARVDRKVWRRGCPDGRGDLDLSRLGNGYCKKPKNPAGEREMPQNGMAKAAQEMQ